MERRTFIKTLSASSVALINAGFLLPKEKMTTRNIPVSGESLPVVGVGTWQTFDVRNTDEELKPLGEVLKALIEKGGSVIDSSPMYGRSEEVVGRLVSPQGIRKSLFLATKVWTNGREPGIRQMKESMRLMNSGTMDLMQIHNLMDWKTHLPTLRAWKEEGTIRYWGITHYHEGAYDQVEQILKSEKPDFLQINYSLRRREAETRILPLCEENGTAVLVNQPFESGSLFQSVKGKTLPVWAKEFDCNSWGQYFLKFILSHPAVTCVIPGTSKPNHLLDNAQAGFGTFPDQPTKAKMISYFNKL